MYTYIHVHIHTHEDMYIQMVDDKVSFHIGTNGSYIYIHMCRYIHAHVHIHTYIHTYLHTYIHMNTCIYRLSTTKCAFT